MPEHYNTAIEQLDGAIKNNLLAAIQFTHGGAKKKLLIQASAAAAAAVFAYTAGRDSKMYWLFPSISSAIIINVATKIITPETISRNKLIRELTQQPAAR